MIVWTYNQGSLSVEDLEGRLGVHAEEADRHLEG